jgi:hypothetical protein
LAAPEKSQRLLAQPKAVDQRDIAPGAVAKAIYLIQFSLCARVRQTVRNFYMWFSTENDFINEMLPKFAF